MHLSVVVASRNDDHGGDMLRRMQVFIAGLGEQCRRHKLDIELILVEWNPPSDRPALAEVLASASRKSPLRVRFIRVPGEVHRCWDNSERIPLFQMIAKNVGIRRALGDFVLCTNVDLLFSDALCEFLATGEMDAGKMYRANRCDVPAGVLDVYGIEAQLKFCQRNIMRRLGALPIDHSSRFMWLRRLKRKLLPPREKAFSRVVDDHACGDFTMMSKAAWQTIGGYPELGLYSIYVDSLGCHAAVNSGFEQVVLSPECCTYHIDHEFGWMSMDVARKMRFTSERPALDWALVLEGIQWMRENNRPLPVNGKNWGYPSEKFEEIVV